MEQATIGEQASVRAGTVYTTLTVLQNLQDTFVNPNLAIQQPGMDVRCGVSACQGGAGICVVFTLTKPNLTLDFGPNVGSSHPKDEHFVTQLSQMSKATVASQNAHLWGG